MSTLMDVTQYLNLYRMIQSLYSYLTKNRWLNIIVAIVYYIIVVTTHKQVGRFVAQNLDRPLGRDNYNLVVTIAGIIALLVATALIQKRFRTELSTLERHKISFYFVSLLGLILIAVNVIMVVNVEIIHIAQYCVMAVLLYPLLRNFNLVMVMTTLLGALDEAYQFWYLFPKKSDYFDFNDVIINFLGVLLGLIILRSQGIKHAPNNRPWYRSSTFVISSSIIALTCIGLAAGWVSIAPPKGGEVAVVELVREYKPGFWRIIPPQVKFHVIRPLEFVILIVFLMCSYRKLGN